MNYNLNIWPVVKHTKKQFSLHPICTPIPLWIKIAPPTQMEIHANDGPLMDLNRLVQFAIDLDGGVKFDDACKQSGIHKRQGFHWLNRLEEWGVQMNAVSGLIGQYRVCSWGPINIKHYRGK